MSTDFKIYNNFKIENAIDEQDTLRIEGFCAHFDVPNLNNERVGESSFNEFFKLYKDDKLKPALNWNHSEQIIGGIDEITKKEKGLFMVAHINKNVPVCDMIVPNIIKGDITGLSTEGYIKDGMDGVDFLDDGSYFVRNFLLTAVAITPTPADWQAQFCVKNYLNSLKDNNKHKNSNPVLLLL